MIYLDIVGRCGNQMFQYSFARKLSILNHDAITIDFYLMDRYAKTLNNPTFRDELCHFAASDHYTKIIDGSNKVYRFGSKKQVFVFKVYTKIKRALLKIHLDKRAANKLLYRIMSHYGIYWYLSPKKLKKCKQKNLFVFGFFEYPAYFDDIKDTLKQELTPKHPAFENHHAMLQRINESESVCVSFRKWDKKEAINLEERQVCDQSYYQKAFELINERLSDPLYVVFSDDVDWVKKTFVLPDNCIFESGNDPVYEKVRLMSACKHFIISNSSFAWWVQYLGKAEDKIVISPDRWANSEKKSPLITPDFLTVK